MRVLLCFFLCFYISAADQWTQVSDFPATHLHGCGSNVVAWTEMQYAISTDGGRSWSPPVAGSANSGIVQAVATQTGTLVLLADGKVRGVPKRLTSLVVDGSGTPWGQGIDGVVYRLGGVMVPGVKGTIYRAISNGVLVQQGRASLVLQSGDRSQSVAVQSQDLPPAFNWAPLTGPGTDKWVSETGLLWRIKDNMVGEESTREAKFLCYFGDSQGYHEVMEYRGQCLIYEDGPVGRRPHLRSRGLPAELKLVCGTSNTLVAVTTRGLWVVDRNQ